MNPRKNQKVYIYFKNGTTAQGIVIQWSDQKSVLKSIHNRNLLIIQNTLADVQMVYVELDKPDKTPLESQPITKGPQHEFKSTPIKMPEKIAQRESPQISNDFSLRTKKISELRQLKIEEEKKAAIETARTFKISQGKETQYDKPSFLFKQHRGK